MNAPRQQPPHDALNQTIQKTHPFVPLHIDGNIPDTLNGTLVRTGPGVRQRFGRTIKHAFEADGVMSAVCFLAGKAEGAVQIVQSDGWHEEQQAGRPLYSSAASWLDRGRAVLNGKGKATGNTSMWTWQGKLYALMEGLGPVEVSPDTLDTIGEDDLGVVPQAFSAHPHYAPKRRAAFNFGCRYGREMTVDFFVLPDTGAARRLTSVTVPHNTMIHDFVVTDTHLLLLVCPARLRSLRALLGIGSFDTWFRWTPEAGTQAIVIPIDRPEDVQTFTVEPFWFWHTGNAWSDGQALFADITWYPNLDSLAEIGTEEESAAPPTLNRCRLDLKTGAFSREQLHAQPFEFPQVHPSALGRPHQTTFGVTILSAPEHQGIARLDGGQMRCWAPDPQEQASEPVLVPRGAAEDDAWVLTLVHDDRMDRSYVAVLDGQRLEDGPVARAWFDQPVTMTFHGTWLPGA